MLAVASDDGHLLAVLTECIELVLESCLELLASDVGKLSLGYEGLGFCANQLLLENHDPRRVWVLVLELGDLIGDLLLAYIVLRENLSKLGYSNNEDQLTVSAGLNGSFNVANALDGDTVLIITVDIEVFQLSDFIEQHADLVRDVGHIFVTVLTPDGQLLL